MASLFILMPIQEVIAPTPKLGPDQTERDNTTVTDITVTRNSGATPPVDQKLILVDNRGIVGGPTSGTSDVEVTWRFNTDDCVVEWLPFGANPALQTSWATFANDGAFGIFTGHDDALNVEAVALAPKVGDRVCTLSDANGEFVTVSTVASTR